MRRRASRHTFVLGSETFTVVSVPIRRRSSEILTLAEQDIAARVAAGQTNRAIGLARGTSPRTVANQLQAVFRKLGVASRAELVLRSW